jgi:tetratricopeptide (TPR) repeat protein
MAPEMIKAAFMVIVCTQLPSLRSQPVPAWRASLDRARALRRSRATQAEQAYRTAEVQASSQDDGGAALAVVQTALGGLYLDQGRYREAEAVLRPALAVQHANPHTPARDLALTLHCLAIACRDTARYLEAESLEIEAIGAVEHDSHQFREGGDIAAYLNSLGRLYLELGRLAEAEKVFQKTLRISEEFTGKLPMCIAESLEGQAEVSLLHGDLSDARLTSLRALSVVESAFGSDDLEVGHALDQLARVDFAMERYHDARVFCLRSLKIKEHWLGPDHDDTLTALTQLADIARIEGHYGEAEELVSRAVRAAEKGRESALLALALHHLALIYFAQRKYAEAEPLFRRSLAVTESVLGKSSPELASCLAHYAQSLSAAGRLQDAEEQYQRAVVMLEQTIGTDNGWLPRLLEDQGRILRKLKRKPEAKALEQRASVLRSARPVNGQSYHTVDVTVLEAKH